MKMNRYALVNKSTGLVENTTLWDGGKGWAVPSGFNAIQSDTANVGDSYAGGVFTPPAAPVVVKTLAELQTEKSAELRIACYAEITGGFASSALGSAYTYPSKNTDDHPDQLNLASSVLASTLPNLPSGWTTKFWCADSSGSWAMRDHTAAQIQQVGIDGKAHVELCQTKLDTLTSQVMSATTKADVQAIVW